MAEPIVFISRSRIREGRSAAFGAAYRRGGRPHRVDEAANRALRRLSRRARAEVRVVHAFPDAAAMAAHFEGSEARSQGAASLIVPAGFEVYGRARAARSISCAEKRTKPASPWTCSPNPSADSFARRDARPIASSSRGER